ncbi:hypothetical protein AJ80_05267 [Polytolypa hystricis UAMH7299]|uniref:Uncharacterized protein n=1 Tax=Polytolypa hystricis (strain UAMH7299) TaxID=1447883 RepID=A0A2B7XWU2_POLH7|nr:hypothetical protein AJ80_05267 [Polytolypa hystricis UAMH7299]
MLKWEEEAVPQLSVHINTAPLVQSHKKLRCHHGIDHNHQIGSQQEPPSEYQKLCKAAEQTKMKAWIPNPLRKRSHLKKKAGSVLIIKDVSISSKPVAMVSQILQDVLQKKKQRRVITGN